MKRFFDPRHYWIQKTREFLRSLSAARQTNWELWMFTARDCMRNDCQPGFISALRLFVVAGLIFLWASTNPAQEDKCSIRAELVPPGLFLSSNSTLTVTTVCPSTSQDQVIEVIPPPGFPVTPQSYQLGNSSGTKIRAFEVQTPHSYLPSTERRFLILLSSKDGELASLSYPFTFGLGLPLGTYFLLGVIGIGSGYGMRLIVDSLAGLPKPVVSAVTAPTGGGVIPDLGRFTRFMRSHYYLMDFLVTLILGFLALGTLVKDNHTPDSGLYWYSAFGLGFAIGLLTNSDLITRLRTK